MAQAVNQLNPLASFKSILRQASLPTGEKLAIAARLLRGKHLQQFAGELGITPQHQPRPARRAHWPGPLPGPGPAPNRPGPGPGLAASLPGGPGPRAPPPGRGGWGRHSRTCASGGRSCLSS